MGLAISIAVRYIYIYICMFDRVAYLVPVDRGECIVYVRFSFVVNKLFDLTIDEYRKVF